MNNVKYVLRVYKGSENPACKRRSVPRLPCFERVGGVGGEGSVLEGVVNNPFATFPLLLLLLLSLFFLQRGKDFYRFLSIYFFFFLSLFLSNDLKEEEVICSFFSSRENL